MSVVAVLQARSGSTRLPGKVLKDLLGQPMLVRQIERIQRASRVDQLIVATTQEPEDDAVAALCADIGVCCYRGPTDDVLSRFVGAVPADADWVVRLTGDCPLADPAIIDAVIDFALAGNYDYASNTLAPTFADGLDVEVVRAEILALAGQEAKLPSEREHVTPFVHKQPARFRLGNFAQELDHSHLRWTVDEPADFDFIEQVYARLLPKNATFGSADVLALMNAAPDLAGINGGFERNEGYRKSLEEDHQ